MARKKRRSDPFSDLSGAAVGLGTLGVTSAVSATASSRAIATLPAAQQTAMAPMMSGYGTIAGFAGVGAVGVGAGAALKSLKGYKKKTKRRRR